MTMDRLDGLEVWRRLSERQREVIGALAIELVGSWVGEAGPPPKVMEMVRGVPLVEEAECTPEMRAHEGASTMLMARLGDAVMALVPEVDETAGTAPIAASAGDVCVSCGAIENDLTRPVSFVAQGKCTRCANTPPTNTRH